MAFAAIASDILLESPASMNELEAAWHQVGVNVRHLGREIDAVGKELGQSLAQAGLKPRPQAPPVRTPSPHGAGRKIDLAPGVPVPITAEKDKPRKKREECIPRPICPHKGVDTWHNYCADIVLQKRTAPLNVVRHEPKCNRKPYKAGKTHFGKP